MGWMTLDLDGTIWDAATGLAAVAEIHTAIKERAAATAHPIQIAFAADFSGDVWLNDTPSAPGGRKYLRAVLEGFYQGIVSLVENPPLIFTTSSAGDTLWTMETLIADVDMGEFAATLRGPQYYSAFLWLREALDRLIYSRHFLTGTVTETSPTHSYLSPHAADEFGFENYYYTPPFVDEREDSWDARTEELGGSGVYFGFSAVGWQERGLKWKNLNIVNPPDGSFDSWWFWHNENLSMAYSFPTAEFSGEIVRSEVQYTTVWTDSVTLGSMTVSINDAEVEFSSALTNARVAISTATIDAETLVDTDVTTTPPSERPFGTYFLGLTPLKSAALGVTGLWLYLDISGELADQAAEEE